MYKVNCKYAEKGTCDICSESRYSTQESLEEKYNQRCFGWAHSKEFFLCWDGKRDVRIQLQVLCSEVFALPPHLFVCVVVCGEGGGSLKLHLLLFEHARD